MSKKLNIDLGVVQETMFFPLVGRALASKMKDPIIVDKKAIEIVEQLNYNTKKVARRLQEGGILAMAARAAKMDKAINTYIKRHPQATIVNIGAGLDTAFDRIDNGQIHWFDLDLPDSISLRKQILPEGERNKCLPKSMLDFSWIDDIGNLEKGIFIQVPGVFPYFKEKDVRFFFEHVAPKIPGAEIIFDVTSLMGTILISYGALKSSGMKAKLKWGIKDARKMLNWSKHLQLIKQESYMKDIPRRWHYSPITNIGMWGNDFLKIGQFFHFKFI